MAYGSLQAFATLKWAFPRYFAYLTYLRRLLLNEGAELEEITAISNLSFGQGTHAERCFMISMFHGVQVLQNSSAPWHSLLKVCSASPGRLSALIMISGL